MKFLIYIALWRREDITRICFEGIKRLQKTFDIVPFCVLSEDSSASLCAEYDFNYIYAPNNPLGNKMNLGLSWAVQNLDFDYLIQINSDNLISNDLMELYGPEFEKGTPYFGLRDIYFVDSESLRSKYFDYGEGGAIGCGKVFKKTFLQEVLTKPMFSFNSPSGAEYSQPISGLWTSKKNQGLDNDVFFRLSNLGYKPVILKQKEPLAIDIKSQENIWSFNDPLFKNGKEVETNKVLERFPEKDMILNYALC